MLPGWSMHEEMEKMTQAGLKPIDVLRLATVNAARWRDRLKEEGTVEAGKQADLLLLRANPLEDIRRTREIDGLIVRGRYFPRIELDSMLDRAADRAAASWSQR
jgi:imidazolonepropionase-like amidohydrolase